MKLTKKHLISMLPTLLMLVFYTGMALANEFSIAPKADVASAFDTGGQAWWDLIATIGMWVCVIGGGILYFAGKPEYVRWAFMGFLIFAFGDSVAKWILSMGGREDSAALGSFLPFG